MGLKRKLSNNWFTRLVLISWIICAVSIFISFKNMELIVHGQLYYYGLFFSPDWADPYRLYTWLIFVCLGVPMALSGVALVSSFFKVDKVPVQQRSKPLKVAAKVEARPIVREAPKRVENGNGDGICCPYCKKMFSKALVMLDFHSGKHKLVSVCPYCSNVLGNTGEEKVADEDFHVATPDKKIVP